MSTLLEPQTKTKQDKAKIVHAECPWNLGYAMCGVKLRFNVVPTSATHTCVVCKDLTRKSFTTR